MENLFFKSEEPELFENPSFFKIIIEHHKIGVVYKFLYFWVTQQVKELFEEIPSTY